MQTEFRQIRYRWWLRYVITHALVTLLAAVGLLTLFRRFEPSFEEIPGVILVSGIIILIVLGGLSGWWTSRGLAQRLRYMIEISRSWLLGNLSLRINESQADEFGLLGEQLNLLTSQLEQDERDLQELRERNMRLADQISALAVTEERGRLVRELHDGVKQYLFSLGVTASAIRARLEPSADKPLELMEMVGEVEKSAQAAQREMSRLIDDLRPATLQDKGLSSYLNDYSLLLGAREHILIYMNVQGSDASLSPSVAETLYRVGQEALQNMVRHSQATRANIQCVFSRRWFHWTSAITDSVSILSTYAADWGYPIWKNGLWWLVGVCWLKASQVKARMCLLKWV